MEERHDVAIVGGGPVGLLLGCLLSQRGLHVCVLERRGKPSAHSRSVGIHPPGLACLAEAGAAEPVLATGIRVRRGYAFGDARLLGKVSFGRLPSPYPFVLCVPQSETERALEQRLEALAPGALQRGHEVLACVGAAQGGRLEVRSATRDYTVQARFVVGCDGKNSRVRQAARIAYPGGSYDEHFVMADLADDTPFGSDAAVFLTHDGVVESFPLPSGMRRWVVGLGRARPADDGAGVVERLVAERTGQLARASTATMVSSFIPEHYLAEHFVQGSLVLAGDAAHVVSPIGGQGMSLGWLDAKLLADVLTTAVADDARAASLLAEYERTRRRAARAATRRAELFMTIGQTQRFQPLRDLCVEGLLSGPLAQRAAQVFTMRGLTS